MKFKITDTDVYGDDPNFFFSYEGYDKDEMVISGISFVTLSGNISDPLNYALSMLQEMQVELCALPKVSTLPHPLQEIVLKQYDSMSGMLFLENDEEFWDEYSEDDLEKFQKQIDEYDLDVYIDLFDTKRNNIPLNVDVITCYMGLSSRFNFIGLR